MNIGSTLPAQNIHLFRARRASFIRRMSRLNPSARPAVASSMLTTQKPETSTELNRLHLANLDKLLQTTSAPPSQLDPQPLQKDSSTNNGSTENKGKSPLEGLNLAGLWSEVKAAEEMSPRHLNRLQRLLSKTNEYSPRNNLGSKWHEYHGSKNWKGLLDPLDENLRREVIRYGEFVQAAYHSFHSNPAMPTQEPPLPRHVALPDKSYKVTKSLYATSSIRLPDMAPEWMTQRSSWIGYVAVCDNQREIQRMGRRDIVIALRGTATCLEWAENVRAQLVQIPENNNNNKTNITNPAQGHSNSKVECGFLSLYKTPGDHVPSLAESVVEEVRRLIDQYKGEALSITITGHSLGAALAVLVADEISTCVALSDVPPIAVFSFGGPRVGNRAFANRIEAQNVKVLRIVNSQDVITRIPGVFLGDDQEQNQKLRNTSIVGGMLDMLDKNMPLAYSHVGTELRVDTKMSPYLKPNADMACCHDLEAYLHLVDGFLASNCPFRANAKRNLGRLLKDQGSNVKKLYTRKAKALTVNLERDGLPMLPSCLPSPS